MPAAGKSEEEVKKESVKHDGVKTEHVKKEMMTQDNPHNVEQLDDKIEGVKSDVKAEADTEYPDGGKTAAQSMKAKFENKALPEEFSTNGKEVEVAFRIVNMSIFTRILEMLSTLCKEVCFQCTKNGLLLQTMDTAQVVLVDLALHAGTLKEYVALNANCKLAFRISDLQSSLKLVSGDFDVYFRKLKGEEFFQARYIDGSEETIESGWFDARLVQNESDAVQAPRDGDYVGEIKMSSARFNRIISQLAHIGGETLTIQGTRRTAIFISHSETTGGEVICKDTRAKISDPNADVVEVNVDDANAELCRQSFAIKYFQVFCKSNILSKQVELKFSTSLPFCVSFPVEGGEGGGHVIFHIAPKIDDDMF
eukprot:GEMP01032323.1.p1 GENE.GEMP01032323.1~~GEMP01032323.1.p1  ORF type:complete len:367 (+),score=123.45 GEMP01032323.1:106-1206(+)